MSCARRAARLPAGVDPMVCGMNRPVIGICTALEQARWSVWDQQALLLPRNYVEAVQRAGGFALLLPPDPRLIEDPGEALELIDGLLLAGGADIDPALLRPARRIAETVGNGARARRLRDRAGAGGDRAGSAGARDLPRHAADQRRAAAERCCSICPSASAITSTAAWSAPSTAPTTRSSWLEGTLAAAVVGGSRHATKSHHHQGVDRLGEGLGSAAPRRSTGSPRRSSFRAGASCSACSGTPRPTRRARSSTPWCAAARAATRRPGRRAPELASPARRSPEARHILPRGAAVEHEEGGPQSDRLGSGRGGSRRAARCASGSRRRRS